MTIQYGKSQLHDNQDRILLKSIYIIFSNQILIKSF